MDWGPYARAIHRWELITGLAAPHPTEPSRTGRPRLAATFVEWMMGLPPGWVMGADLALPRSAQLRGLGNGVVPQQAAFALRYLIQQHAEIASAGRKRSGPKDRSATEKSTSCGRPVRSRGSQLGSVACAAAHLSCWPVESSRRASTTVSRTVCALTRRRIPYPLAERVV